jgi:hypothetical protein
MQAEGAYLGRVPRTREELIALVERLQRAEFGTEQDGETLLAELRRAVPDPEVSDLIFWTYPPLSAAEVVDRALAYEPVVLGQPAERTERHDRNPR